MKKKQTPALLQLSSFYYHQLSDSEKLRQTKIEEEVMSVEGSKSFVQKIFTEPQVYKPLIILLFMFLFQQFSGCYILIFYTINILRNLSLNFSERINENMALMLLGALRLLVSVIASG
jgi:facilitated trehalose transporter